MITVSPYWYIKGVTHIGDLTPSYWANKEVQMQFEEVATIAFQDSLSGDHGLVIITAMRGQMSLCLSLERNGDLEIALGPRDCAEFLAALKKALAIVQGQVS
jgi:hypothetical protein